MDIRSASAIADSIVARLAPGCERIQVGGSIRRGKPDVGDIEIVCIPKLDTSALYDIFGEPIGRSHTFDHLNIALEFLIADPGVRVLERGERYVQLALPQGINLDLFIVRPPAQWGVILAIRTGPAAYSQWLVTKRQHGGALPSHMRVHDGALWSNSDPMIPVLLATPEEQDFFDFLGIPMPEPSARHLPVSRRTGTGGMR